MNGLPFSWMWGDPALTLDQLRSMRSRMEAEEKRIREQARLRKARKIRKLTKLAIAGKLKGDGRGK